MLAFCVVARMGEGALSASDTEMTGWSNVRIDLAAPDSSQTRIVGGMTECTLRCLSVGCEVLLYKAQDKNCTWATGGTITAVSDTDYNSFTTSARASEVVL